MKSRGFPGGKRFPPGDSGGVPRGDPFYQTPLATNHADKESTFSETRFDKGMARLRSGCTERSTHNCARVPADLAQASDGGGKVGGGSREGF